MGNVGGGAGCGASEFLGEGPHCRCPPGAGSRHDIRDQGLPGVWAERMVAISLALRRGSKEDPGWSGRVCWQEQWHSDAGRASLASCPRPSSVRGEALGDGPVLVHRLIIDPMSSAGHAEEEG